MLVIFSLFIVSQAGAQAVWDLEFVGGFNVSRLTGDTGADITGFVEDLGTGEIDANVDGSKIGLTGGVLVTVGLNNSFGIQSGLMWSRKGGDGEVSATLGSLNLTGDLTITLDYVEIPILGVLSFPVGETVDIRAMAGPVLSFNSKAEIEVADVTTDIGDFVKSVDIGILVGGGLVIPLTSVDFIVDARYTFGLSSVDDTSADLDLKNGSFTILAGIGIPLGL